MATVHDPTKTRCKYRKTLMLNQAQISTSFSIHAEMKNFKYDFSL